MKLGIIGLPNAGKTTFFETLTGLASDSPVAKMENRLGIVPLPDERIGILTAMYNPKKTIYTQVEYLLPGNTAFQKDDKKEDAALTQVRVCYALLHVVRNFTGLDGKAPDPAAEFSRLDQEMIFADLMVVEKRLERLAMDAKRGKKGDPEEEQLLRECQAMLEQEEPLRRAPELAAAKVLKGFTFLSAKPQLVLFNNADEDEAMPADAGAAFARERCAALRGRLEHELSLMSEEERQEYLEEFGITTSAKDWVVRESYGLLGLISFFTVGPDEVRAWTIRRDTTALDAAEVIHSDIKKGFIRAEVLAYADLMAAGSYKDARKLGTARLEGKTYLVQDGDIIEFRFNV